MPVDVSSEVLGGADAHTFLILSQLPLVHCVFELHVASSGLNVCATQIPILAVPIAISHLPLLHWSFLLQAVLSSSGAVQTPSLRHTLPVPHWLFAVHVVPVVVAVEELLVCVLVLINVLGSLIPIAFPKIGMEILVFALAVLVLLPVDVDAVACAAGVDAIISGLFCCVSNVSGPDVVSTVVGL